MERERKTNEQLDNYTKHFVFLTLVQIFREDTGFGKYSFYEIGYRLLPGHESYTEEREHSGHVFSLIQFDLPVRVAWYVTKKMLQKKKTASEISALLRFLDSSSWLYRNNDFLNKLDNSF